MIAAVETSQSQQPTSTPPESHGTQDEDGRRVLADSESFANTLARMSQLTDIPDEQDTDWARPVLAYHCQQKHITFQQIDIQGSNQHSGSSEIHIFGVTKAGHSILVRVLGFEHYFYFPAPREISESDLVPLGYYINDCLGDHCISEIVLENQCTSRGGKSLRFMKIYLFDHRQIGRIHLFASGNCRYRNIFVSPERCYETTIPYPWRFMLDNEINAMAWLHIPAKRYTRIRPDRALSLYQLEVSVQFGSLMLCDTVDNRDKFAPLRILSFDLECEVRPDGQFSSAQHQAVIQIGNMVSTYGCDPPFHRNIFTLKSCSRISGPNVYSFEDESKMLMAWRAFFVELDPDIVIGYNITQFDIPYLLNRAEALNLHDFPFFGRIKESRQYLPRNQRQLHFLECPGYDGRLLLDIFHHIRENYRGLRGQGAYKLSAVAAHFLGDKKEDVKYWQIPALQSGDADTRRQLALYCLKDSYLPLRLMAHLKCFEKEVQEAKDAHVPYNALRDSRDLKGKAKRYLNAIAQEFILFDGS